MLKRPGTPSLSRAIWAGGLAFKLQKPPQLRIAAHPFGKLRAGSCKKRKDGHDSWEWGNAKMCRPPFPDVLSLG